MSDKNLDKKLSFFGGNNFKLSLKQAELETSKRITDQDASKELDKSAGTVNSKRTFSRSVTMKSNANNNIPRKTMALGNFERLDKRVTKDILQRKKSLGGPVVANNLGRSEDPNLNFDMIMKQIVIQIRTNQVEREEAADQVKESG